MTRPVSRACAVLTVLAVVLASGAVHGVWTNRWATPAALERATARMADLPLTLGDWVGEADQLDARQVAVAEISGHLLRRYVNRRTGAAVSVLLVCGRPGPVAVHTPEVCYGGLGYELVEARAKAPAPAEAGDLWVYHFQKPLPSGPEHLRIFCGWSVTGGLWVAADNPRRTFARHPALYKLYVRRQMPREDEPVAEDPALEFLRVLFPALRQALSPGA